MNSKLNSISRSTLVIKTIEMLRHVTDFGGGGGFLRPQAKGGAE
jgi:hypothetical protein